MGRGRGKRLFFCGTGGKSLQKKVEKGNLENDGPIVRSFVRREGLEGISASARETRAAGRQTANKQRERERTFKKTPEKRHESAGHEMGFARPNRPHPHSRMSLCFGGRPPQHEPVNEKRKPEGLRFLRVGHPANNRYRCFLSNLAGLAASRPTLFGRICIDDFFLLVKRAWAELPSRSPPHTEGPQGHGETRTAAAPPNHDMNVSF